MLRNCPERAQKGAETVREEPFSFCPGGARQGSELSGRGPKGSETVRDDEPKKGSETVEGAQKGSETVWEEPRTAQSQGPGGQGQKGPPGKAEL